ncbi:MAG: isoprenylcysteine carboxylmethyltransferase family protein [Candidatus Eremiobacteraeota bacterium]|nr:isoprenylcysteine carboxylmethyltransferase family protein [Candidatus Eremiobacteraeota bacterium]MBV8498130.1 isoprenylcysteine carboxylmethyltransferase family protein [Candidatus Eremiobacteraeota bacterium]
MTLQAFVFKNRGLLLSVPAAALTLFGRPSARSVALGLPLAIAGELVRCWAVGYSGATTRNDAVTAPKLVTDGPYGYVRNPLYIGNFLTAAGFAFAFTGRNSCAARCGLLGASLAAMAGVYAIIVPHEEAFLREQFGDAFDRYCERVPRLIPQRSSRGSAEARWDPDALLEAESKTFALFGAMLAALVVKAGAA